MIPRRKKERTMAVSSIGVSTTTGSTRRLPVWLLLPVMVGAVFAKPESLNPISRMRNPFSQGCLFSHGVVPHVRLCNSEDSREDMDNGICRAPTLDYMEMRSFGANWESRIFAAWIVQIVLSELVGVPATVESGMSPEEASLNFYDPFPPPELAHGANSKSEALETAFAFEDCRMVQRGGDAHKPCAHFTPEIWDAEANWTQDRVFEGTLEPPTSYGIVGEEALYVTKFTLEQDPSFATYIGLKGDRYRQKLAETFKRPLSWLQYCEQVSIDNCTTSNQVAQRPPKDETEAARYFVDGSYIGNFQYTDQNNCTLNNDSCTGHFADYPCDWTSFAEAQFYHLNIALESNGPLPGSRGYSYSQLRELWQAANATKSNLIMFWYTPEPAVHQFMGSDAEFHKITMKSPTKQCLDARPDRTETCNGNNTIRVGGPEADCGDSPKPLQKVVTGNLFELTHAESIPEAVRSPAYDVLRTFRLFEHHLGDIASLKAQFKGDARQAVCQWAVENVDFLQSFTPQTYPRVLEGGEGSLGYWTLISVSFGSLALLLVLLTVYAVHRYQGKRSIRIAQIEFLYLLLAGLVLVATGSVVIGIPPSNGSCVLSIFLINLGYALELVPLIIKIAGINRIMSAARHMRRVRLEKTDLYKSVVVIVLLVLAFLISWSVVDPPYKEAEYILTGRTNEDGARVVNFVYFCSSDSGIWEFVAIGWNGVLLFSASVLAFQTRLSQHEFNESRTLSFLIYSHFLFVIIRVATFFLRESVNERILSHINSSIFSCDTIAAVIIYMIPKLLKEDESRMSSTRFFQCGVDDCHLGDNVTSTRLTPVEVGTGCHHLVCESCGYVQDTCTSTDRATGSQMQIAENSISLAPASHLDLADSCHEDDKEEQSASDSTPEVMVDE
ncbi:Metabotropic glutamate receptor 1 [Seminavis robusta]|uniref:Metabotropic glutamate receptor 1 n=1 Tax=Seminavis robusta TaxID=568900 RepID=A0A9N8HLV9_9STRA|nr:Metabotropic glutamate receptor 1 [Seminavis robusta]|eukprot:Sro705_g190380.1 Metabotropic glutamate receptor 1 (896) ;mRNA; f:36732-39532